MPQQKRSFRASVQAFGTVILIPARIFGILVFGYYAVLEVSSYNLFRDSAATLFAPPLSREILVSHRLAVAAAIYGAICSGVCFLSLGALQGKTVIFMTSLETLLLTLLALAVGYQATSIGVPTQATCDKLNSNGAPLNLTPDGANKQLIFWERVGTLNTSDHSYAHEQCHTYLVEWAMGMSMTGLCALCVACGLYISFPHWLKDIKPPVWNTKTVSQTIGSCIKGFFYLLFATVLILGFQVAFVFIAVAAIVMFFVYCFWFMVPKTIRSPGYFATRYVKKRCYAMFYQSQSTLEKKAFRVDPSPKPLTEPSELVTRRNSIQMENRHSIQMENRHSIQMENRHSIQMEVRQYIPLASLLQQYPIMKSVAENLHYFDLVQLGLVSKSVRSAVFPDNGQEIEKSNNQRMLRLFSCDKTSVGACWLCETQVCDGCSFTRAYKDSYMMRHESRCRAQCTRCYYRTTLRHKDLNKSDRASLFCVCAGGQRTRRSKMLPLVSPVAAEPRTICRGCPVAEEQVLKLKDRRDTAAYLQRWRQPESCAYCDLAFSNSSTVWWVCSSCNKECPSMDAHLHHVKKRTSQANV